MGLFLAYNVHAITSNNKAPGRGSVRDRRATTESRLGLDGYCNHHICAYVDRDVWSIIPSTAFPNPHRFNCADAAIPVTYESRTNASILWSAISATRTTNRPDINRRPNGKTYSPVDVLLAASDADYAVVQQDPHTPHIGPANQAGLPQVEPNLCLDSTGLSLMRSLQTHSHSWREILPHTQDTLPPPALYSPSSWSTSHQ